jgi:hypothetical protein
MFTSDPTLYGATLPQREFPYVNPFYGQFGQYGQYGQWQQPWSAFYRYFPPFPVDFLPQGQFNLPYTQPFTQPFYGNKMIPQVPYPQYMPSYYGWQGAYNWPQFKFPFPIA